MNIPSILIISGHDPSGAGIQADIETVAINGCHAVSVLTCITSQNTFSVKFVKPISRVDLNSKITTLLEEFKPRVIKIGLVPNSELCEEIAFLIKNLNYKAMVVLDPIIRAGSGDPLIMESQIEGLKEILIPHATLITPNRFELFQLTKSNNFLESKEYLFKLGVENMLATDLVENKNIITNAFVSTGTDEIVYYSQPRVCGEFHGSGCTLTSAIACGLVKDKNIKESVLEALHFTNLAISNAYQLGTAQKIPNRSAFIYK